MTLIGAFLFFIGLLIGFILAALKARKEVSGKKSGFARYSYFIKNRKTGQIIELGSSPTLSTEEALKSLTTEADWLEWEFDFRKEEDHSSGR